MENNYNFIKLNGKIIPVNTVRERTNASINLAKYNLTEIDIWTAEDVHYLGSAKLSGQVIKAPAAKKKIKRNK